MNTFTADHIVALKLALRKQSPFFGTLVMYAEHTLSADIAAAATDGRTVYYNVDFMAGLTTPEQLGVLAHEVLHMAYNHVGRRGSRDARLWNAAADYTINLILVDNGFKLPVGALLNRDYAGLSSEEVYSRLVCEGSPVSSPMADIVGELSPGAPGYWEQAVKSASLVTGMRPRGIETAEAIVDWRSVLTDFLTPTQDDFSGYDRRFIWSGQYEHALKSDELKLAIAVDTSGSISARILAQFLAEVEAILAVYPTVRGELYYFDATFSGPHEIGQHPSPLGGGGTSLLPLWAHFEADTPAGIVVFTDGWLHLDTLSELAPTLWITPPGTRREFPFGSTVVIVEDR